jgi:hypothetical protein
MPAVANMCNSLTHSNLQYYRVRNTRKCGAHTAHFVVPVRDVVAHSFCGAWLSSATAMFKNPSDLNSERLDELHPGARGQAHSPVLCSFDSHVITRSQRRDGRTNEDGRKSFCWRQFRGIPSAVQPVVRQSRIVKVFASIASRCLSNP